MIDLEAAMSNPARAFDHPDEVAGHDELTRAQKIEILRRWRYDALQREVAQEENMQGSGRTRLQDIVKALSSLGYQSDDVAPTKSGGA